MKSVKHWLRETMGQVFFHFAAAQYGKRRNIRKRFLFFLYSLPFNNAAIAVFTSSIVLESVISETTPVMVLVFIYHASMSFFHGSSVILCIPVQSGQ
jgi:hypothetical protein